MQEVVVTKTEELIAKILLESNAVTLNAAEPFRFTSGILSPIYCDNRILISLPEKRSSIIDNFIKVIKESAVDLAVIAGTATAGIPHAAWIAHRMNLPMIYIRGESKAHGKKNTIEGILNKGDRTVIIEDLISTGSSSVQAVKAVKEKGGVVLGCYSIFTYQMKKAKEAFEDIKCPVFSLTNFSTLVKVAKKEGFISEQDEKIISEWNGSPQEWGRKMGFE